MKLLLHKYQVDLADFLINNKDKACICRLWLGAGKTVAALFAIKKLIESKKINNVLIITPPAIAKNWIEECNKWDLFKDLTILNISGTPIKRTKLLKETADIYLISMDLVDWLVKDKRYNNSFDMLVIDESCHFKNSKTLRFKSIKRMSFKYKLLMTGTFGCENKLDIWSQLFICDRGKRLGSKVEFCAKYFEQKFDRSGFFTFVLKKDAEIRLLNDIQDICFLADRNDYDYLPDISYNDVHIEQSHTLKSLYNSCKKDAIIAINDDVMTINNATTKLIKLRQICSGHCIINNESFVVNHDKIKTLKNILEDNSEPFIIVYFFEKDKEILLQNIEGSKVYDDNSHQLWNAKQLKYLLLHHSKCDGLNLQAGGSSIIWYTLSYSLKTYNQMNARVYRTGQKNHCYIHHLIMKGTIEEEILKCIKEKKLTDEETLNYLLSTLTLLHE